MDEKRRHCYCWSEVINWEDERDKLMKLKWTERDIYYFDCSDQDREWWVYKNAPSDFRVMWRTYNSAKYWEETFKTPDEAKCFMDVKIAEWKAEENS